MSELAVPTAVGGISGVVRFLFPVISAVSQDGVDSGTAESDPSFRRAPS